MLKHNKKRNSFIVYEQLITLATRLAAGNNNTEANYVIGIIKEYYSPKTNLGKEYKLMRSVFETKARSKEVAKDILQEALSEGSTISEENLNFEKGRLINAVNKSFSKDFYKIPVKNYKHAASLQILMNESRSDQVDTDPAERANIKNMLIENLAKKEPPKNKENVDNLTLSLMIQKFNKRYANVMNEDQREILAVWTNYLINKNEDQARTILEDKVSKLKSSLTSLVATKGREAKELKSYLQEANDKLKNSQFELNENSIYEVMRYFDLAEDLKNYEKEEEQEV